MTERRETGRPSRKPSGARPNSPRKPASAATPKTDEQWNEGGERIAKYLARAGVASRREIERLIEAGDVSVNGKTLTSAAFKVTGKETIKVGRKVIKAPDATRLWRYHKPSGLITTTDDPAGRRTVFHELPRSLPRVVTVGRLDLTTEGLLLLTTDGELARILELPKSLPRVVTVGRLDLTTEGLLLLTNDGELARFLELPKSGMERTYRVRAKGTVTPQKIEELARGITVDGVTYQPIKAVFDREMGANSWLTVTLTEGKKREVRRALESLGLTVNRLIRISYGPFHLTDLKPGQVEEIPADILAQALETLGAPLAVAAPADKRPAPKSHLGRGPRPDTLKTRRKIPRRT